MIFRWARNYSGRSMSMSSHISCLIQHTHTRFVYIRSVCAQFLMNCFRFSPFIASSYTFSRTIFAFRLHDSTHAAHSHIHAMLAYSIFFDIIQWFIILSLCFYPVHAWACDCVYVCASQLTVLCLHSYKNIFTHSFQLLGWFFFVGRCCLLKTKLIIQTR